ncbi:MAG: imidazolonepropionase-like amidohydrolase [Myxococcota bacterium]|jgi:imidazolonepropionase-like amidohydrolase
MILFLATALAAPTAFVGGTLHPVSGPPVQAALVVDGGRIVSIGAVPPGAVEVDVSGKHLVPGLVDTHSHVGGGRLHEHLGPVQPGVSAVDAIDPTHASLHRARAGGITTVNVMPGSGRLMGGQTAYLKLRLSPVVDDLLLCVGDPLAVPEDAPLRRGICGGMKMANGTNPQGDGDGPSSRMGAAFLQREALRRGAERLDAVTPPERLRRWTPPEPDPEADALAQIVAGARTVHFHTHRADDVVTIARLVEEYPDVDVVLHHVSEAWKLVDLLAEAGLPCSLILVDAPGGKEEALEIRLETGGLLERAGVPVAFHTDDPITDSRLFLRMGALAVRGGMSPEGALAALTLAPARMLGLQDRLGSLEVGKDADVVVLSGVPFSVWTRVEQTWVDGMKVFDRADPADRRHATGGEHATQEAL